MLPDSVPLLPGYSFWAAWEPDFFVGGDLYDFQTLPTGEILMLVADVAGKHIPASLGMAFLAGMIPFAVEQTGADITKFVAALNDGFFRWTTRTDRFVSLVAVALNPVTHQFRMVDAAHTGPAIIRRRDGTVASLCSTQHAGFPLGVAKGLSYEALSFHVRAGDSILIASDGITIPMPLTRAKWNTAWTD